MKRPFHKMHGLGNDFVILDARERSLSLTPMLAKAIADRRTGIGCDQIIVLEPSEAADLRMRVWNSDGSEVDACGNATRCVVRLTNVARIETLGGQLAGKDLGTEVEVVLEQPRFGWNEIPISDPMDTSALPLEWDELARPFAVNVGNPHVVFFVRDAQTIPLSDLGPRIERDPVFPQRVNVNVASLSGDGLFLRTFERGARETLACGTGACATAVAAIATKRLQSPVQVTMAGGTLTVDWLQGSSIRMRGGATHVYSGDIDLEQLA